MAIEVHHVQGVKLAISFDIPGTHQVYLVDIVNLKRPGKVRVLRTFGNIGSFF